MGLRLRDHSENSHRCLHRSTANGQPASRALAAVIAAEAHVVKVASSREWAARRVTRSVRDPDPLLPSSCADPNTNPATSTRRRPAIRWRCSSPARSELLAERSPVARRRPATRYEHSVAMFPMGRIGRCSATGVFTNSPARVRRQRPRDRYAPNPAACWVAEKRLLGRPGSGR